MDELLSGDEAGALIADRAGALAVALGRQLLIGLNGAQGSGKSTMARVIAERLEREHGLGCAILSLDDFYLRRAERAELAAQIHPLFATRGVPGTHDVALLRQTLTALAAAGPADTTALPRFDKLADDRLPEQDWTQLTGRPDCVLLEGWCVGIRRADLPPWRGPINPLEAEHDGDGSWFSASLAALAEYEEVWDAIDLLVSIEVPDLATVIDSRLRQERGLAAASERPPMDRAAVTRFVQHYERYTRALWAAMPRAADCLLRRDGEFRFTVLK